MTGILGTPRIDEGSGRPLLVFHGWSGSKHNIERWLPALTPFFRVIGNRSRFRHTQADVDSTNAPASPLATTMAFGRTCSRPSPI